MTHRSRWTPAHHTRQLGLVIYPYPAKAPHEISLTVGRHMRIIEQNSGWFRGHEYTKPSLKGIFPSSYVHVVDSTVIEETGGRRVIPQGDQLPWELIDILTEWRDHLHSEYIKHIFSGPRVTKQPEDMIEIVTNNMFELITQRRKFNQGAYSTDELQDFKLKMTEKIDWTNWKLGLDLLPKSEEGDFLNVNKTSTIQLFKTHLRINDNVSQRVRTRTGTLSSRDTQLRSVLTPNHIYVVLKKYSCVVKEDSEVLMSLYNHQANKFIRGEGIERRESVTALSYSYYKMVPKRDTGRAKILKYCVDESFYFEMGKRGLGLHAEMEDDTPKKNDSVTSMLYMDVGPLELLKDLYLIVKVVRRGRMLGQSGKQVSNVSFICRRPFGVGVLPLDNILKMKRAKENTFLEALERNYSINIHLATKDTETLFASMHEDLIKKHLRKEKDLNSPSLVPGTISHSVHISLKPLEGDLNKLLETFPHLLTKEIGYVNKLGFPEVILPGLVRNHMYIHLIRGDFEKGNKKAARNVEVTVALMNMQGEMLNKSIQYGEGEEPSSCCSSVIYYHTNNPRFDENFRINIPVQSNIFKHCHLRFAFRHVRSYESTSKRSEKAKLKTSPTNLERPTNQMYKINLENAKKDSDRPFAYAFLRLTNQDDTMIKDDIWTLYFYKVDDDKWEQPFIYLALPSYKGETHKTNPFPKDQLNTKQSPNETFTIQTMTVSTNLTQTVSVMSFLKWREQREDLTLLLQNLCLVSGQEIIKFMRDIFDNLFNILIEQNITEKVQGLVFNAIVKILHLLTDKKYDQFKTVLDEYIESHFSASTVHRILLEEFAKKSSFQYVAEGQEFTAMETVWHTMSSLEYMFKFIIQSQKLQIRIAPKKHYGHKLDIEKALNSLHLMMSLSDSERPGIIKGQAEALKNFCSGFPVHLEVKDCTKRDIADWAANFVESYVDRSNNISQNIIYEARLIFIENILQSSIQIMLDSDARNILLPVITRILSLHLMKQLCIKKTIDVVGLLVHCLQSKDFPLTDNDITQTVVELLAPTMEFCSSSDQHGVASNLETAGTNLSNLLGLLDIMQSQHYEKWLERNENKLSTCFKLFLLLVKNEMYPRDWTFMYLTQNRVILKAIKFMSMQLTHNLNTQFDDLLWKDYFDLATRFITHRSLQLENYGEIKRLKFLNMYGDMRIVMARDVLFKWNSLRDKQKFFIPYILHSFLEISLVKEKVLRKMIIPVFYDIMRTMYAETENLQLIEEEIMDTLDDLVSKGRGDEEYTNIFNETLLELCNDEQVTDFRNTSLSLVSKVTKLLERLVDFRNIPPGDEYRNQRLSCIVNLMNFYKEIDHLNVYIRYIHKLFDIHEGAENYCEAANALLFYTDMLETRLETEKCRIPKRLTVEWTDETVPPMESIYESGRERDRKEYILKKAIEYFDKGKAWEKGIVLCKELGKQYEEETFEYFKLSEILQTQASFYVKIIQELRFPRAYFKAGFFGRGFPLFLRNKSFVYQGNEYEKLNDFMSKLQEEFPKAQLMSTTNPPDETTLNSDGMFLQIFTVEPIPQEVYQFKGKHVPEKVLEYYKGNSVRNFIYNKAYHVGEKDKNNEFATMWIERTTFTTQDEFPGILKWSEVVDSEKIRISPLENAINTVEGKNKEIFGLITKYKEDLALNINPLSMALNGVIDAAVMGGISNYQKAFLNDNYLIQHPEHTDFVQQLNLLIIDQIEVLKVGLTLHSQRVAENLKPFQEKMEICFQKLEQDVFGKREPTPTFFSDMDKTIGTHPLPSSLDDPAMFTQSLFISSDIRTSKDFDLDASNGRYSPNLDSSPPASPSHDRKSPKKSKGFRSLGRLKPKMRPQIQSAMIQDAPTIPSIQPRGSINPSFVENEQTLMENKVHPPSIVSLPLPPIPTSGNGQLSKSSEYKPDYSITEDDYECLDTETAQQILRKASPMSTNSDSRSNALRNRNSKTSLQSDDTNQSNTSSTDLDSLMEERNAMHHDPHFPPNTDFTPPVNPPPFHTHHATLHEPQPQARKNAPPPPVPMKKGITKSVSTSNETLHRIDALTKPLKKSYSPPINPRNSRSFTVVEVRHHDETESPDVPPHNNINPPKRKASLVLSRNRKSSEDTTPTSPPSIPPRNDPLSNQSHAPPPPIPQKEPPPVPRRPSRLPNN